MAKTLVIKLAETIDNDEFRKLGEMRFNIKPVSTVNPSYTPSQYTQNLIIGGSEAFSLAITGDGYFTDETLTQNLGKTFNAPSGTSTVYVSDGDYTLSVFNKYVLTYLKLAYTHGGQAQETHKHWHINLADLSGVDALRYMHFHWVSAYGGFAGLKNKNSLIALDLITENGQVTGDLGDIAGLTSLTSLNLYNSGNGITGDISSIAGMTELTMADLRNCYKLTGNTSSIASLHPNNGGKLATLVYSGTQVTGDWPPSA